MLTNFPDGLHPIATASIAVTVPALQKALLGSVPIPPVPTRLTATGGAAQVSLSWNVSSGAIDYNIRRSTVSGGPYTTIATGVGSTSTNYTDTGLASGRIYYYIASAVNGFGESADSAQVSATTQGGGSVPPTPTGLTATTVSSSQINLSWTASSGATSYNVKRATVSGGPYTTIAPGVTATSYSDTGLAASTTYYYVVSAVNSVGESANSAQANATTQTGGSVPPAPTGLTATTVASSQINLSWTASSGATSYNVKRATVSGGLYTTIATGVTGTTYNNTGLAASTTYYYVVSAVNSTGESPDSIEASATTQAGGGGLPSPWLTQDVGAVGVVGSATYSSGTYTVVGSGTDISRNADQFRYVYQTGGANCTITARLASMTNPNSASKAGVMIRETLATGSTETSMTVTPANGVSWQTRTTTDGTTGGSRSAGLVAPYWVRVVRSGNTFTGYMSPDGVTWTQQGTTTITMGSSVYIGLAVTSRNNTTTCTATFDNVTAAP
jgi:cellulose 1,4-beta-cellobiosidase